MQARKEWDEVFYCRKKKNKKQEPRILYPEELIFKMKEK